jgi:hypothetical protein
MSLAEGNDFLALLSADNDERATRIFVRLPGRFMLPDKKGFSCLARSMSPIMLRVESEVAPSLNEHVVIYLQEFGRIEGWVERLTPHGFAIVMVLTAKRRERIDLKLKWFFRNGLFECSRNDYRTIAP